MFTQLKELSKKAKLTVTIETDNNNVMDVLISFDLKDRKERSINLTPIPFTGTAETVEAEFPKHIKMLTEGSVDTLERINYFIKSLKEVETLKVDEASGKKPTTKATPVKKKAEPVGLFAEPEEEEEEEVCDDTCEVEEDEGPEFDSAGFTKEDREVPPAPPIPSTPRPQTAVVTGTLTAQPILEEQAELIQEEYNKALNKSQEVLPVIESNEPKAPDKDVDDLFFTQDEPIFEQIETPEQEKQRLFDEMVSKAKLKGLNIGTMTIDNFTVEKIKQSIEFLNNKK